MAELIGLLERALFRGLRAIVSVSNTGDYLRVQNYYQTIINVLSIDLIHLQLPADLNLFQECLKPVLRLLAASHNDTMLRRVRTVFRCKKSPENDTDYPGNLTRCITCVGRPRNLFKRQ